MHVGKVGAKYIQAHYTDREDRVLSATAASYGRSFKVRSPTNRRWLHTAINTTNFSLPALSVISVHAGMKNISPRFNERSVSTSGKWPWPELQDA